MNSVQLAERRSGSRDDRHTPLSTGRRSYDRDDTVLPRSLDLLADIVRNPAFEPREVERLRAQQLAGIAQELTQPQGLAGRQCPLCSMAAASLRKPASAIGGGARGHPHDGSPSIAWIRPTNATIFAIGTFSWRDGAVARSRFGNWRAPAVPGGTKQFPAQAPAAQPRIVLIDRPQSPQSIILAGQLLPVEGTQDLLTLTAANEALGGNFLARINMDLREAKGWSYGAAGGPNLREHQIPYIIQAPVQADRTGDSIQAIQEQVRGFLGPNGVQPPELNRIILGNTRQLPGQFETSIAVLGALRSNALFRRPDNYWEARGGHRYRAMDAATLDQVARGSSSQQFHLDRRRRCGARAAASVERLGLTIEV